MMGSEYTSRSGVDYAKPGSFVFLALRAWGQPGNLKKASFRLSFWCLPSQTMVNSSCLTMALHLRWDGLRVHLSYCPVPTIQCLVQVPLCFVPCGDRGAACVCV